MARTSASTARGPRGRTFRWHAARRLQASSILSRPAVLRPVPRLHYVPRPDGMVANAWAKGYRMGVQASSDHMGTHAAYAMILSPDNTREALLDAMRARHAYAATDNIIVDFRLASRDREFLMGDDASISSPPRFRVRLIGTNPIGKVELVKNNAVVYSLEPNERELDFEYTDNEQPGEEASFFYVRLRQNDADRQIAWSSPIWVSK